MEKTIFIEEMNTPKMNNKTRKNNINRGVCPDGVVIREITHDKKWEARARVVWIGVISGVIVACSGIGCSLKTGSYRMSKDWRLFRPLAQSDLLLGEWFCDDSGFSYIPVNFKGRKKESRVTASMSYL